MARKWSSKAQFKNLKFRFAQFEGRDFERKILPLLQLLHEDASQSQAFGSVDTRGIDILAGREEHGWKLGVQCKGFHVTEDEIGYSQIRQCLSSIEKFENSTLSVERYILIHNRDGRNSDFRFRVGKALGSLVEVGRVESAAMWDIGTLLDNAFEKIFLTLKKHVQQQTESYHTQHSLRLEPSVIQEKVPCSPGRIQFNQYGFNAENTAHSRRSDPIEFIQTRETDLSLVLGEFGMGKTTAAFRLAETTDRTPLFLPAALLPAAVSGAKDILSRCFRIDLLFENLSPERREIYSTMAQPAAEKLVMTEGYPVILIFDGLDESPLLSRSGGIASLFDALAVVKVPVVLTMRTEFWEMRKEEFAIGFEGRIPPTKRALRNRELTLVQLDPWTQDSMVDLVRSYRQKNLSDHSPQETANLTSLETMLLSGNYEEFYGDIPKRPLFLAMLIEHVTENGISPFGRARLMLDWTKMKIYRDVRGPRTHGTGRPGISEPEEPADLTSELAYLAMQVAAQKMTIIEDNQVRLKASVEIQSIVSGHPSLIGIRDPLGIFLNSLLMPVGGRELGSSTQARFAHFAFQEFFLALSFQSIGNPFGSMVLPSEVTSWQRSLADEMRNDS